MSFVDSLQLKWKLIVRIGPLIDQIAAKACVDDFRSFNGQFGLSSRQIRDFKQAVSSVILEIPDRHSVSFEERGLLDKLAHLTSDQFLCYCQIA